MRTRSIAIATSTHGEQQQPPLAPAARPRQPLVQQLERQQDEARWMALRCASVSQPRRRAASAASRVGIGRAHASTIARRRGRRPRPPRHRGAPGVAARGRSSRYACARRQDALHVVVRLRVGRSARRPARRRRARASARQRVGHRRRARRCRPASATIQRPSKRSSSQLQVARAVAQARARDRAASARSGAGSRQPARHVARGRRASAGRARARRCASGRCGSNWLSCQATARSSARSSGSSPAISGTLRI